MTAVHRTDLLPHAMNAGKEADVRALSRAWQNGAVMVGTEQWRLFFESGRFDKNHRSARETDLAAVVGAANRLQMVRYQVVGVLDSFLSNRQNDFTRLVQRHERFSPKTRHQMHFINRWKAWYGRTPITMKDGTVIPAETRVLARRIMQRIMSRHRRPNLSRINMVIDQRAATLRKADSAGEFPLWLRLSTMERGRKIEIPLRTYGYFDSREGIRKKTVTGFGLCSRPTEEICSGRASCVDCATTTPASPVWPPTGRSMA